MDLLDFTCQVYRSDRNSSVKEKAPKEVQVPNGAVRKIF